MCPLGSGQAQARSNRPIPTHTIPTSTNPQTNTPQFQHTKKCERWTVGTADGLERMLGYPSIGPGIAIARKPLPKMPAHLTQVSPTKKLNTTPSQPTLTPWLNYNTHNHITHTHPLLTSLLNTHLRRYHQSQSQTIPITIHTHDLSLGVSDDEEGPMPPTRALNSMRA